MRLLLLFGLCAALSADTYPRQPGIDVQHYVFRVTLSDDSDEISGETTITIRFVKDGVTQVALDLGSAMTVSEVGSYPFRHDADRLIITLNLAPKSGEIRQFSIKYHGKPAFGLKILRNRHSERCFFSSNWPDLAHHWLPTIDHPSDKATGEFIVVAPSRYQVVANGVLEEETDLNDGRRVTHWNQRVPIATWLYNIGVAQFASRHFGTSLVSRCKHGSSRRIATRASRLSKTRRAELLNFSAATSDLIRTRSWRRRSRRNAGAMEHASAIFYGEREVTGKPAYQLVAHETAHQWFGDSVTEKDWDDVWLSEGFATYFAELATEHYDGRDAFLDAMRRSREQVYRTEEKMPGVAVVQDKPWKGIPNAIVYQKGGWVLHRAARADWDGEVLGGHSGVLPPIPGRERLDGGFSGGDGGGLGRRSRCVLPAMGISAGSPAIQGWWKYNGATKRVELELEQTQSGEAYRLPLEVAVGAEIRRIDMTEQRQRFEIAAEHAPPSVTLDPNTWTLIKSTLEKR